MFIWTWNQLTLNAIITLDFLVIGHILMPLCTFNSVNCVLVSRAEVVLNYLQVSGDNVVTQTIIKS